MIFTYCQADKLSIKNKLMADTLPNETLCKFKFRNNLQNIVQLRNNPVLHIQPFAQQTQKFSAMEFG